MSKKFEVNTHDFNPLDIAGLQLYLNRYNATPSSWLDVSSNAFNFAQATATKQPTVTNESVNFSTNDEQGLSVPQIFGSDYSGIIFFSGYHTLGTTEMIMGSANNAVDYQYIYIVVAGSTNKLRFSPRKMSADNIITADTTTLGSGYFYGYLKSNGSSFEININGVIQALVISGAAGANNGDWFADVPNRDDLTLAALKRTSIVSADLNLNKLIYSNAALSSGEIDDIMSFMSDENN